MRACAQDGGIGIWYKLHQIYFRDGDMDPQCFVWRSLSCLEFCHQFDDLKFTIMY